jgi:hypothetical protein
LSNKRQTCSIFVISAANFGIKAIQSVSMSSSVHCSLLTSHFSSLLFAGSESSSFFRHRFHISTTMNTKICAALLLIAAIISGAHSSALKKRQVPVPNVPAVPVAGGVLNVVTGLVPALLNVTGVLQGVLNELTALPGAGGVSNVTGLLPGLLNELTALLQSLVNNPALSGAGAVSSVTGLLPALLTVTGVLQGLLNSTALAAAGGVSSVTGLLLALLNVVAALLQALLNVAPGLVPAGGLPAILPLPLGL